MRMEDKAKYNSVLYLILSVVIRWGYNLSFIFTRIFSPLESAVIHMLSALIAVALAWMSLQLYRRSVPGGSNLGCFYLIVLFANLIMSAGAVFAALVHLFAVNGGEIESLWLL
jgi:hypothetical protein